MITNMRFVVLRYALQPTLRRLKFTEANLKRYFGAMQSDQRGDHMDRTAQNTRHEIVSLASVIGMRDESKTVKSLELQIHNRNLVVKAGQWLDVFIPDVATVGGFSMCSSPLKLTATGQLDLAVKFSKHPPAFWVHSKCEVGSKLHVKVGGDFFYDPAVHADSDLLLIAGGVGINPLYSILNHVNDLQSKGDNSSDPVAGGRVMLLYSSQTLDELIFRKNLNEIQNTNSRVQCQYFITKEDRVNPSHTDKVCFTGKRITADNVEKCFDWLRKDRTLAYICGPSSMLTDMERTLLNLGMNKDRIKYEKWW